MTRLEDPILVRGEGSYVSDRVTPETLHAHFVRSPMAHGILKGIDRDAALALPGVHSVVTAETVRVGDLAPPHLTSRTDIARPVLAREKVRYVGEPVAMVVADTPNVAADAADLVWLDLDDLPVALAKARDAAEADPPLFQASNVIFEETIGPGSRVDADLPLRVKIETHNQRIAAVPIEGIAIMCEPISGGRLRVTCGTQAPHRLKGQLASSLGIGTEEVQVVVPDVGGAFGLKGMYFPEYSVVAATALELGRPIVWLEGRREHLTGGMHGRDQTHRVTLEGDETGRIKRAHFEITADVGAYPQTGAIVPTLTRFVASGLYDIEEVTVDLAIIVTNRAPTASYRGAGRPEGAFAIERAIDAFAHEAGLDPAEVRRTNFIQPTQLPYRTSTGATYDSGDYPAALDMALDLVDEPAVRREQTRRLADARNPIGLGIGAFIERTGAAADSGEFADVEIDSGGNVVVRTGSTGSGQGHRTVWAQTMAELFDVLPGSVDFRFGDTDEVADGVGTYGSRSAQVGASAAYRAGVEVREKARRVAADILEASPDDIVARDGGFEVVGVPGSLLSLVDIAAHAAEREIELRSSEMFVPGIQAFPYGVHVAVVDIDRETGVVQILRLVSVDDCGHVLNPMIVEGQMHGSLVQGLGQALLERVVYNEDGVPLSGTMMDYLIPSARDVPPLDSGRLVSPALNNPLGVKGTGEAGCIGAPPAIVNAAIDALRPFGVNSLDMPLTPDRIWTALKGYSPSRKS